MGISCDKVMKQLCVSYSKKRAVLLAWTPNLPALILIKPGLMLLASVVSCEFQWVVLGNISLFMVFPCCIFLVVLFFSFILFFPFIFIYLFFFLFVFSSFYHKRWTRMNVWLFLLITLLPWEITEAIANPAFTDAVFLHQWCPTWCALNAHSLCCWKQRDHALNPCPSLLTQTGHGQAGCHQQRESGFYQPWQQSMCPPERKECF